MGYLDKMHKKAQMDRMIREIMNSHEYKKAVKKDNEQLAMRAYCNFCFLACDYLEEHHNYGSKRLIRFLEFAVKRMKWIAEENPNYYEEMNDYFVKKFNINVFDAMGIGIKEEGAVNG